MRDTSRVGQQFGRLTILAEAGLAVYASGQKNRLVTARCQCGDETQYRLCNLQSGNTQSCGCLNSENRAKRSPQTWTIDVDVAYIELRGRRVLIDAADVALVSQHRWRMRADGYVHTTHQNRDVFLHRLVLGLVTGDGLEGDHRNHMPWDNRRSELRIATRLQNLGNSRGYGKRRSRYKGVERSNTGQYMARIGKGETRVYLGNFYTEEDAAKAYDAAAKTRYGEFAHLNFPVMEGLAFARQQ